MLTLMSVAGSLACGCSFRSRAGRKSRPGSVGSELAPASAVRHCQGRRAGTSRLPVPIAEDLPVNLVAVAYVEQAGS